MTTRQVFKKEAFAWERLPKPGELIRSENSNWFINLVISVGEPIVPSAPNAHLLMPKTVIVNSVRYARNDRGCRVLLRGHRARPFEWNTAWEIVKEFTLTEYDNSKDIADHLASIKGRELLYTPPGATNV